LEIGNWKFGYLSKTRPRILATPILPFYESFHRRLGQIAVFPPVVKPLADAAQVFLLQAEIRILTASFY